MSENTSYFMNAQVADSFGSTHPGDEGMHRLERDRISDPALVETVFCGFSVPEADIHCLNYVWLHPNLRLMSGGAWVWKGIKQTQLEAELFDMRDFVPDRSITDDGGDLLDVTLPNGYRYQVLEPLERIRMSYADPHRGNAFDVTATAVMPPAMLPSNRHFDQMMRTSGTVTLRGEELRVDGYSIRDRSWGEARTEDPTGLSGIHWLVAMFGDDYAVHVTGLEDPSTAQWRNRFDEDAGLSQKMNRGWVWRDGRLLTVTSARIETEWDTTGRRQAAHRVVVIDETGAEHRLHGEIRAAAPWHTWSNVHMSIGLARWECDGRVGHGDSQVAMWTDFVRAAFGDSA
ncbi:hypothetical protein [Mycobacterium sp. E1747]|uniref:DUF7064 domain-containing protein n=1 Tax=Mycobacterium sp. E1747 TaxID=1834128 RepID=UPI0007FDA8C6|nr:hypothetical protein [Mycobacterium sp. E1747]OBH11044.1 hypothetical protein A5695_20585 [Mycobacterium sp. E1747]